MRGHLFLNQNEYLTVEEFHLIRNMDLPQDFLDFLEIGFRTGLRSKDILSLKRENIDLQKERIIGTPQHFSQGAHDFSHWGEWRL